MAVSAVRELVDTADPFLAAVVTRGQQVVGVAHLGRRPSATQQTALEWLYPKSLTGWALVLGRGKRPFVAPGDPRHPRHALDPPSAA